MISVEIVKNEYNYFEGLRGVRLEQNARDALILFVNGEKSYVPNECFKIIQDVRKIKKENVIIDKENKGREMKKLQKVQLLKSELDVTNEIMLECDLVGILVEDNIGQRVDVIKNRMNGVQGLIPGSMWDSLVDDYTDLEAKADKQAEDTVDEIWSEAADETLEEAFDAFTDLLDSISGKPEVKKATSKFNDIFEGVAKSFDTIRPKGSKLESLDEIAEVFEAFGKRGDLQSFLESIGKTVEGLYDETKEKAKDKAESVKESVKTKADKIAAEAIKIKQKAKLTREKAQLDLMIDNARLFNVSTKGFEKKVQKKIDLINKFLG